MNNFSDSIKRFFTNKNTVTILGVLVSIAVLYFGYTWRINQQVEQITVLVAKQDIQPRTKITSDMVETVSIARVMYNKMMGNYGGGVSVLRSNAELSTFADGAYSNVNSLIPAGTPLIRNVNTVERSKIPSSVLLKIDKGQVPYAFSINYSDTYGNAIMDGMYVNIYMKAVDDTGKTMIGKLIQNVKVLAVLDSSGRDVFENTDENRTPATLIFSVDEDLHLLLRKARYLSRYSVELIPVPVTESVSDEDYEGTVEITSSYLREFIESRTIDVPLDELPETDTPEVEVENGEEQ
ncbi:MAG: hypothetical protein E7166_05100 [Firmicutes bacterium]|nr:hypothetical protein [Bacillota bacterium]